MRVDGKAAASRVGADSFPVVPPALCGYPVKFAVTYHEIYFAHDQRAKTPKLRYMHAAETFFIVIRIRFPISGNTSRL